MIDLQTLFMWILGLLVGGLAYWGRSKDAELRAVKTDLAGLRDEVHKNYVVREDCLERQGRIYDGLERIEKKLDRA